MNKKECQLWFMINIFSTSVSQENTFRLIMHKLFFLHLYKKKSTQIPLKSNFSCCIFQYIQHNTCQLIQLQKLRLQNSDLFHNRFTTLSLDLFLCHNYVIMTFKNVIFYDELMMFSFLDATIKTEQLSNSGLKQHSTLPCKQNSLLPPGGVYIFMQIINYRLGCTSLCRFQPPGGGASKYSTR